MVPCGDQRPDKNPEATSEQRLKMIELLIDDLITKNIPIKVN
jgi:hypothetical protein